MQRVLDEKKLSSSNISLVSQGTVMSLLVSFSFLSQGQPSMPLA